MPPRSSPPPVHPNPSYSNLHPFLPCRTPQGRAHLRLSSSQNLRSGICLPVHPHHQSTQTQFTQISTLFCHAEPRRGEHISVYPPPRIPGPAYALRLGTRLAALSLPLASPAGPSHSRDMGVYAARRAYASPFTPPLSVLQSVAKDSDLPCHRPPFFREKDNSVYQSLIHFLLRNRLRRISLLC